IGETVVNSGPTASDNQSQDHAAVAIDTAGDFVVTDEDPSVGNRDIGVRRFAEAPVVSFTDTGASPSEAAGTTQYAVQRAAAPYVIANLATSVSVTNPGGTATPGVDFTTTFPQTVTIAAGSTSQTATVSIVNDSLNEGDETIVQGI